MKNFIKQKPTKVGYYWYKELLNLEPIIVEIKGWGNLLVVWRMGNEIENSLEYEEGYWLGPIRPETES